MLFSAQSHRHTQMQIFPVDHCPQRRISHSQFARNTEIPVPCQGLFHSILFHLNVARPTWANHVLQQLFVLLQQSTAAVIAQYAKEHVLVVCEMRDTLDDIDVSMLWTLARCVFRPPPHHYFAHLVQNAVSLFKVPALSPAHSVREMSLEHLKERYALSVQFLQVAHCHVPLPAHHIPFQSFDKYFSNFVAWVLYQRHIVEG